MRKLTVPRDLFVVAAVDEQIIGVGYLGGSTLRRFAHEVTLAITVVCDWWGKGIGRALMHAMVNWADTQHIVRISLEVVATNTRAVRLYESFGFEHEGRLRARRRHGDTYCDNLVMARVRLPR